ncbi:MAG: HNH endonuclease [Betaproteobacteria bacterium]
MSKHRREPRSLGPCPMCGREMIEDGASVNEHHLVPRSRGGKETTPLHRICHAKLHSRWTERELAERYSSIEAILADEEIARFVAWVRKKHPQYYDRTRSSASKGLRQA